MADIILASSSPRRRELLSQLGLDFQVYSPEIDETRLPNEAVAHYVKRLACEKAAVVLEKYPNAVIIAADTSISIAEHVLGKPRDKADAFAMWHLLSGKKHDVFSGVCVLTSQQNHSIVVQTQVEFQQLSLDDMEHYWATGEPIGKAGAYAIQGIAAQYIPSIHGSYSNVVGLPLYETAQLLKAVKALN